MDNVTEKKASITLGGEEREIHFGMKAWKQIEDEYGSVMDIGEVLKNKPFANLPNLIFIGLKNKESITKEDVLEWLDEYNLTDLKALLEGIMAALYDTAPEGKKRGNPQKSKAAK